MKFIRRTIAILTAPAVAGLLMYLGDLFLGASSDVVFGYLTIAYFYALVPTVIVGSLILHFGLRQIGWFIGGGLLVAIVSLSALLGIFPFITGEPLVWASYIVDYCSLLVIGALTGAITWLIAVPDLRRSAA